MSHLALWDLPALEAAESDNCSSEVTSLRVGATLFSTMPLDILLQRLARFTRISKVIVADDRVYDRDMPAVEQRFKETFANAAFEWHWDGLISGKHGR